MSYLKKTVSLCLFLGLAWSIGMRANTGMPQQDDPTVEKKKTINRSYSVSGNDRLSINNSFGTVEIKTWDKNEFKVDITITAIAADDAAAQRLLNSIKIIESQSGGYSFKTDIGSKNNGASQRDENGRKGKSDEFHVDYLVYMPASNPLTAENSFGDLKVADMTGETQITSKFGNLEAGKLTKNKSVQVEFGNGEVSAIHGGKATVKFGNLKVGSSQGDVKLHAEFSSAILGLTNNINECQIFNSYSTVRLNANPDLAANFKFDCSFGECSNKTSLVLKEVGDEEGGLGMDKKYSGNNGDGRVKVSGKCSFGSISINNPGDPEEESTPGQKKKNKHKEKNKETII